MISEYKIGFDHGHGLSTTPGPGRVLTSDGRGSRRDNVLRRGCIWRNSCAWVLASWSRPRLDMFTALSLLLIVSSTEQLASGGLRMHGSWFRWRSLELSKLSDYDQTLHPTLPNQYTHLTRTDQCLSQSYIITEANPDPDPWIHPNAFCIPELLWDAH